MLPSKNQIQSTIDAALEEDYATQDVTTNSLFPNLLRGQATVIAKEDLVVAGIHVAKHVFNRVDPKLKFIPLKKDGDLVKAGMTCCTISGDTRSLLAAERVALNFLQHLSGIASLTHKFCLTIKGSKTKILDTRKTTPGLRYLQKWAVRLGGGTNHRQSLKDGILIKDNHLALLKAQGLSVEDACHLAKKHGPRRLKVCVEADTLEQVQEAVKGNADIILLDNMTPQKVKKAIQLVKGRALTEISGGITLKNIHSFARVGADFISIGALTHSAPAMDLSMRLSTSPDRHSRRRT